MLIRVSVSGICQTDVHIAAGEFPVQPPRTLGHELAGTVAEVAPGVGSEWLGRSVGIQPATYCGQCTLCVAGLQGHCLRFRCLGNTEDGGWAEWVVVREDQLVPLEGGLDDPWRAVWLEPLSCVVHAVALAEPPHGGRALVIGAGPMGLLAVQVLRAMGAGSATVIDVNASKLELALRVGADDAIQVERDGALKEAGDRLRALGPMGFETIIETTGRPVAIERAVHLAAIRATVVLFGVSDPAARLTGVSPAEVFSREIVLRGAAGSTIADFQAAQRLLADGAVQTDPLVWRVVGLPDVPDMVQTLGLPGDKGKVLVDVSGQASSDRSRLTGQSIDLHGQDGPASQ